MAIEQPADSLDQLAAEGALALRRQVNGLLALLGKPSVWREQEPMAIAVELIGLLHELLRADVVALSLEDASGPVDLRSPTHIAWSAIDEALARAPAEITLPRANTVGHTSARLVEASFSPEAGRVVVGSWRANFPTPGERLLLRVAVDQAALAMQAWRKERAQAKLAEETRRLVRLQRIAEALAAAVTLDDVARNAVDEVADAFSARSVALYAHEPDARVLKLLHEHVTSEEPSPHLERIALSADVPVALAFARRERSRTYGTGCVVVVLPLVVGSRAIGALQACIPEFAADGADDAMLVAIAHQFAQALDRARLFEAERRQRAAAEVLAEASARLSLSLDYEATLGGVASLMVGRIAEWCVIELDDTEPPRVAAAAHVDSQLVHALRTCWTTAFGAVVRTMARERNLGLPVEDMTEAAWASAGKEPALARTAVDVGVEALFAVPITSRRGVFGTIALGATQRTRFGRTDFELVEELGRRIGSAIDNAHLYREARDADRRKEEFLAMLGHELRNPLAPIRTAVDLMRLKDDATFAHERTLITRHVEHLMALVDDLLDVSRITSGKLELRCEALDFAEVLRVGVEMAAPLLEQRAHRLEVDVQGDAPSVFGDRRRLAQVVSNLLQNAAKFTPVGGHIAVLVERAQGRVILRVRDSGIGIAPEMLDRIFETFVQDQRSVERARGGLGLGLAIARRLVQLHDGTIEAFSAGRGCGSTFVVSLPLHAADADVAPEPPSRDVEPVRGRVRVLIVDDNVDAAESTAELLRLSGHDVRVAYDAPTALQLARQMRPDVAFVDLGLPVMDGFGLARRFRGEPDLANVALVAVTGYGQPEDRARTRAAGFAQHLVKPVSLEDAQRAIAAVSSARPSVLPAK